MGKRIDVQCEHCGHGFDVPATLKGGVANCPDCRRATDVRGGFGWEYNLLALTGLAVVLFLAGIFGLQDWRAGATVLGVGLTILLALRFSL